jgi:phage baseplate assembly protein W
VLDNKVNTIMANFYRGFSTVGRNKKFRLTDLELVKQDLINHFHIRKGEKLMNPNFGTIIWNVLHEPLTEELKSVIIQDVNAVVSYDPRVAVDNVIITEYEQGLQLEIEVRYLQTNQLTQLLLQFDQQSNNLTAA